MVTLLSLLWFFISIAFIVMLIITIIKAIKKKNTRTSLASTIILFIIGLLCFITIGIIIPTDTNETNKTNKVATQTKEKKDTKKVQEKNVSEKQNKSKENKETKPKPGTTDKIPVELSSVVDGDTAKLIYNQKEQTFRFLLIDTPETKHPKLGKQPFGQEASDRTAELLENANKIEVEFDVGQKQDKYKRNLAYIYVDGKMLNDILVREGLAKVAYAYPPNTRYLSKLEKSQEAAKTEKIGIWSLNSAFEQTQQKDDEQKTQNDVNNEKSTETNSQPNIDMNEKNDSNHTVANDASDSVPNSNIEVSESFPNCTALRQVHPNGVPKGHPAYAPKHDRDKDGYACEVN